MKNRKTAAVRRRACRLGPHWVAVESRGGEVARVRLGKQGTRDDRELAGDLERVLQGGTIPEHLHVNATGLSAFTRRALGYCARIRPGEVMTYAELAKAAGRPRAARAVGQVMASNPFALLIPCHRVVGSDCTLHGFGGGLGMKEWLLAREGWEFEGRGKRRRLAGRSQKAEVLTGGRRKRSGAGVRSG